MRRELLVSDRFRTTADPARIAAVGAEVVRADERLDGSMVLQVELEPPATDTLHRLEALLGAHPTRRVDDANDAPDRRVRIVAGVSAQVHDHVVDVALGRRQSVGAVLGELLDARILAIAQLNDVLDSGLAGVVAPSETYWVSVLVRADTARSLTGWARIWGRSEAALAGQLVDVVLRSADASAASFVGAVVNES